MRSSSMRSAATFRQWTTNRPLRAVKLFGDAGRTTRPLGAAVNEKSLATVFGSSLARPLTLCQDALTRLWKLQEQGATANQLWRPMTAFERTRRFPFAMYDLLEDVVEYQNIVEASNTARNAWATLRVRGAPDASVVEGTLASYHDESKRSQFLSLLLPGSSEYHHGDDAESVVIKIVPRRQHARQRQTLQILKQVAALVVVWIPPVVGWIPTILAVVAPRQAYSFHFHSAYEVVQFAQMEQDQREEQFHAVIRQLSQGSRLFQDQLRRFFACEFGTALVKDSVGLYRALFESRPIGHDCLYALDGLNHNHVYHLSLAMGLYQSLPTPINKGCARAMGPLLRSQLRHMLNTLVEDDTLLLMEGHHRRQCATLSDKEVLDASMMRNLPILLNEGYSCLSVSPQAVDYGAMRKELTHHLESMEEVSQFVLEHEKQRRVEDRRVQAARLKERLGLFAAHLSILRQVVRKQSQDTSEAALVL